MENRIRNQTLVPEAKHKLDQLKAKVARVNNPDKAKYEIAKEIGVPLHKGYNGNLTSEEAGKVGGRLGGRMVKELIIMAQRNLSHKNIQ